MQGLTYFPRVDFRFRPAALWGFLGTPARVAACSLACLSASSGCAAQEGGGASKVVSTELRPASSYLIQSAPGTPKPPFEFSEPDDRLLDEVQRASFWYLWNTCDSESGMVYDRSSVKFASVAGVGFQLAAIPAAIERGWISRTEGQDRAARMVRTLASHPQNRKHGMFFHFLDGRTGAPIDNDVVSTIDTAILLSGLLVASEYFGGEVRTVADGLVADVDWTKFTIEHPRAHEPYLKGFVSLGWRPKLFKNPTGEGELLPFAWADSGDEHRLICFMAALAPKAEHRLDPTLYYRLRRGLGEYKDSGVHVWFPWSGALFVNFFSHCFINYAGMAPDDPAKFGVERRPRVDWWENSRRSVMMHRQKAIDNPKKVPTLGENAWGLSASDCKTGYCVPGVFPQRIRTEGEKANIDFADFVPKDDFGDGTIAPYAAGCAIMFEPVHALAALRYYRSLDGSNNTPQVWRDPGERGKNGEAGFRDAFNLGTRWVAEDGVAIDHGPLVLAIENARSGLIWKTFHRHPMVQEAEKRLGFTPGKGRVEGSNNR